MAITKKQMELDKIKWEKSEKEGKDACGTFDFCEKCDKSKENPCDKAYKAFNKPAAKRNCKRTTAKTEVAATKAKPAGKTKK